jgi:diacylglycerol kinase family enzyme
MKEMMITMAAVVSFMSCKPQLTEREMLIQREIKNIDNKLDIYYKNSNGILDSADYVWDLQKKRWDNLLDITMKKTDKVFELTDKQQTTVIKYEFYSDKIHSLYEQRKQWVLQQSK